MVTQANNKAWLDYFIPFLLMVILFVFFRLVLPATNPISFFFLNGWYVQALSTWLFFVGVFFWRRRQRQLKGERALLDKVRIPDEPIYRNEAKGLIDTAPGEYKDSITVRRFKELLQGALFGEDIIRLNGELSRRDIAEIEQGHLVLDSLKNIIPVVGFLGTVIGLSLGMIQFPEVTDIEALRSALKGFAASLSISFNTTVLALIYTIILILLTSALKEREESLVGNLDEHARLLISGLRLEMPHETANGNSEAILKLLREINEGVRMLSRP